jgi:hypothetical protein
MDVTIRINCDNAAFIDDFTPTTELARILRELADKVDGNKWFDDGYSMSIMDINGNSVGHLSVTERVKHV